MTTKFKRYDFIENSSRQNYVEKIAASISMGHCEDDFVVEEKAHGANFAFYYDGKEMKTACRSCFLENDGENFCKSHLIKRKYASKIRKLYDMMGGNKAIRVVGELIGGSYRHPDVEAVRDLPRIHKGIDYCPGHEFYVFDLFVLQPKDDNGGKELCYVPIEKFEMNALFEKVGMLYAKSLFRGTFGECLAFGNTFKSHIPSWIGLPEHPGDNIAEGKVIKPVKFATTTGEGRIILKDKTERFAEIAYGNKTHKPKSAPVVMIPKLSDKGTELLGVLCAHLTENRLDNVLSKMPGPVGNTPNDHGRVCGLLSHDALEDFNKDFGKEFDALEPKERKNIKKYFSTQAMGLVRAAVRDVAR